MQAEMPFFDSPEDALKAVIQHIGGVKRVGPMLFPEKTVDAAARYLLDCVNHDRQEKLSLSQVMMLLRLAHEAGHHTAFSWLAAEIGYDIKPITKADEVDRLTNVIDQSTKTLAAALDTLERLQRNGTDVSGRESATTSTEHLHSAPPARDAEILDAVRRGYHRRGKASPI